jgi:hypothetical protein
MSQKHVKVGEVEIPTDYWSMEQGAKTVFCLTIIDSMLTILDKQIRPDVNRMDVLDLLLKSSIMTNEFEENYEVCQVLQDIRNIIDEEDI